MNPTHSNGSKDSKAQTPPPVPAATKAADASKTPSDGKPNPGTAAPDAKVHGSLDAKTDESKADQSKGVGAPETEKKARVVARRVYLVVGEILEFENAAAAEKFLNTDASAPTDYSVIKGLKIERKNKVSLR